MEKIIDYMVNENDSIVNALKKINLNKHGFVVVVDDLCCFKGVLTDGDVRRLIIRGWKGNELVSEVYTKSAKYILLTDDFRHVSEIFKDHSIRFLPILDECGILKNIITKDQFQAVVLWDIRVDLSYDFLSLDTSALDYEIFQRPWGYFKTAVLNEYFQGKVLSIKPYEQISLQLHNHREEYWIVVHGNGSAQLDNSLKTVSRGSVLFIPKGCKHRLSNTDKRENLIVMEVQIGDYFGEDDIIRYEDSYGRTK